MEWGEVTRFLNSARLAFARERALWISLEIADPGDTEIRAPTGQGTYQVSLDAHVNAVSAEETLFASVLMHTYAIAEAAAADQLGRSSRTFGGIEDWGGKLLRKVSRDWNDIFGGKAGAVEVAVVRNTYAHGVRAIDASGARRIRDAGGSAAGGDPVSLTYTSLRIYRDRLRSLLRVSEIR